MQLRQSLDNQLSHLNQNKKDPFSNKQKREHEVKALSKLIERKQIKEEQEKRQREEEKQRKLDEKIRMEEEARRVKERKDQELKDALREADFRLKLFDYIFAIYSK